MTDSWMEHLSFLKLLDLHNEAQKVGYRVRVANGWTFDIEYEGGLNKYYQRGMAVKTYQDTDAGREEAKAFLADVGKELENERRSRAAR